MSRTALILGLSSTICLCLCCTAHGQTACSAEAKILVDPVQVDTAIAALSATKEAHSTVYLFDTDALDLFSQGVIVRLRIGPKNDLTVKLRSSEPERRPPLEGAKCETDFTENATFTSLSATSLWASKTNPVNGADLYAAMNPAQEEVLRANGISVDWSRVRRQVEIQATSWQAHRSVRNKVTIELWDWPGGTILELSTRTNQNDSAASLKELQEIARRAGLRMEDDQSMKTSRVFADRIRSIKKTQN